MGRSLIAAILLLDVALVLSDAERNALVGMIGAGLQSQPQMSPQATYLLNKLNTAPVVQSQKPVEEPKKEPAP